MDERTHPNLEELDGSIFCTLKKRKMLLNTLLTNYGWLITNVPHILHSDPLWKSWFDNLTEHDILSLKMNISGIKYSRDAIVDEFDNYDPN